MACAFVLCQYWAFIAVNDLFHAHRQIQYVFLPWKKGTYLTYPSCDVNAHTFLYIFLHCKRKLWPTNNSVHHTEQYFCPIGPRSTAKQQVFSSLAEQGVYSGQAFAGVFPTSCPLRVEICGSTYCTAIFSCSVCIQHWRFWLYITYFIHCPSFEMPAFDGEIKYWWIHEALCLVTVMSSSATGTETHDTITACSLYIHKSP